MNKSLEALERLCKVKIYQKEASAYDYLGKEIYKEEINTIKQDLEDYEKYKEQWSSDTHCWIEDNIGTFYVIDKDKEIECRLYELPIFNELLANVDKLLYENKELKELQELNKQGLWNLKQENLELSQIMQLHNEYIAGVERVKTDLINENKKLKNVDKLLYENQELKDKNQILEQSVKDTYDTLQEIIADLKEEKERWRKLCLCWREAYIECDEKFHNLCKEVSGE